MNTQDFEKLVTSVKQAGKIKHGNLLPGRKFEFTPYDIKKIRRKFNTSQSEFAILIGVSVSTIQNWEQGRRYPEGPARALLKIASVSPGTVVNALHS